MESVSFDQIHQAIQLLAKIPEIKLVDLQGKYLEAYNRLNLAAATLFATDHYAQITSELEKYSRPEQIQPLTVGAFLFGSRKEVPMDIPEECSLLDMGTLARENTEMIAPKICTYQVIVFSNDSSGTQIYSNGSTDAYVYLSLNPDQKFEGLTPAQITELRRAGITHAQIMGTADSTHHTIKARTPIEELAQKSPKEKTSGVPAWALVLIGLLIVVLLVMIRR